MDSPSDEHKSEAPASVRIGIITVSDSRDINSDESGKIIKSMASDHEIVAHMVVQDNKGLIKNELMNLILNSFSPVDAIIINGGTGIGTRDITLEAVEPLFEKKLTAFSELFSGLSYGKIGSAAMLSRAAAGIFRGKVIFCLPGSPQACELAMEQLILPELGHIMKHLGD